MKNFKLNILFWIFVLVATGSSAGETVPQRYICYRTEEPIVINGLLDEPTWKKLPAMENWTVLGKYTPPKYQTTAKICWDDTNLYVGFECIDEDIFAKRTKRDDNVFLDDAFEIYIDPDGDEKNYIEIEVSPVNTIFDLLMFTGIPWKGDTKFNVEGMQTAERIYGTLNFKDDNDEKWVGEMAIPLECFAATTYETNPVKVNLPPKDGDVWRIQLYRAERGKNAGKDGEWSAWSPSRATHVAAEFGYVKFLKKKPQEPVTMLHRNRTLFLATKRRGLVKINSGGKMSKILLIAGLLLLFAVNVRGEIKNTKEVLDNALVFAISQGSVGQKDLEQLSEMGVDVIVRGISCGWNASPKDMYNRSMGVNNILKQGYQKNILWSAMITSSAIYPDILPEKDVSLYACRDADGKLIKTGGGWWQGCLRNPNFFEFTKQIARAGIDAQIWGIHYDEEYATWFWSRPMPCFCDYCIEGFKNWLKKEVDASYLKERGVADLNNFNYRDFLRERNLVNSPWESPLHDEYWRFLVYDTCEKQKKIVEDAKKYCREKWGVEFIANANQFDMVNLSSILVAESKIYDFVNMGLGLPLPGSSYISTYIPSYIASKACAYDRPVVMFLDIQEEPAPIAVFRGEKEKKGQIFRWLSAEAYSSGCFYALHHLFSNFRGPVAELIKIGKFIKASPHLFKNTKPVADVYLMYSFTSNMFDMYAKHWGGKKGDHIGAFNFIGKTMLDCGMQFSSIFLGEGRTFPDNVATSEYGVFSSISPKDFPFLIIPEAYGLTKKNIDMIKNYVRDGGKLLLFGECGRYDEKFKEYEKNPLDELSKQKNVIWIKDLYSDKSGFSQKIVDILQNQDWNPAIYELGVEQLTHKLIRKGDGRLIVHLINKNFKEGEGFKNISGLKLSLKIPKGFSPSEEVLCYSPDWESYPQKVKASIIGDSLLIPAPKFDVWLILEVKEKGGK